jgi:hypothetical protein
MKTDGFFIHNRHALQTRAKDSGKVRERVTQEVPVKHTRAIAGEAGGTTARNEVTGKILPRSAEGEGIPQSSNFMHSCSEFQAMEKVIA